MDFGPLQQNRSGTQDQQQGSQIDGGSPDGSSLGENKSLEVLKRKNFNLIGNCGRRDRTSLGKRNFFNNVVKYSFPTMSSSPPKTQKKKENPPSTTEDFVRLAATHLGELSEIEDLELEIASLRAKVARRLKAHPYLGDFVGVARRLAKKANPEAFVPPAPKKKGAKPPPAPASKEAKQKKAEKKAAVKRQGTVFRLDDEGNPTIPEKFDMETE